MSACQQQITAVSPKCVGQAWARGSMYPDQGGLPNKVDMAVKKACQLVGQEVDLC